jgi:molecular chaperone GrpE
VQRQFQDTLGKQGVAPIPAVGEPFNAEVHEAVMLDEDSEEPDETVTAELRKGYTLHSRVIRPSLVKVAKRG